MRQALSVLSLVERRSRRHLSLVSPARFHRQCKKHTIRLFHPRGFPLESHVYTQRKLFKAHWTSVNALTSSLLYLFLLHGCFLLSGLLFCLATDISIFTEFKVVLLCFQIHNYITSSNMKWVLIFSHIVFVCVFFRNPSGHADKEVMAATVLTSLSTSPLVLYPSSVPTGNTISL